MKSIALVGFMGSGKTAAGRALAEKLGVPFIDLDEEIEKMEGRSVGRIFAEDGEDYFRRWEREVLRAHLGGDQVLAVGGGAYTSDDNIALINARATAVWLKCPLEVCRKRCSASPALRPLFADPEDFARLYKHRRRFYSRAHHRIDCSESSPEEVAGRIIETLRLRPES